MAGRRGKIPDSLSAPLAQLAEQLTLNQGGAAVSTGKLDASENCAAPGAAVGASVQTESVAGLGPADTDLAQVISAWPSLPTAARADIVAKIRQQPAG